MDSSKEFADRKADKVINGEKPGQHPGAERYQHQHALIEEWASRSSAFSRDEMERAPTKKDPSAWIKVRYVEHRFANKPPNVAAARGTYDSWKRGPGTQSNFDHLRITLQAAGVPDPTVLKILAQEAVASVRRLDIRGESLQKLMAEADA